MRMRRNRTPTNGEMVADVVEEFNSVTEQNLHVLSARTEFTGMAMSVFGALLQSDTIESVVRCANLLRDVALKIEIEMLRATRSRNADDPNVSGAAVEHVDAEESARALYKVDE